MERRYWSEERFCTKVAKALVRYLPRSHCKFCVSSSTSKRAMALVPLAVTALLSPRAQTRKAPTFASRRQNGPLCSVNAEPQRPRANVTTDIDVEGASEAIRTLLWHDSGGFESIDADKDGSITREEFTDAMAKRAAQEFESTDTSNTAASLERA